MADFSNFGGSCREWDAYVRSPPVTVVCRPEDAEDLQRVTNQARADLSTATLERLELDLRVQWKDYAIEATDGKPITIRAYQPRSARLPLAGLLWFHGGGFLFGSLETEAVDCALLALNAGMVVLHACYRHTPQWPFPTAHDDAWSMFEWAVEHRAAPGVDRLIVGGVSAGGNLAASTALRENRRQSREAMNGGSRRGLDGVLLCTPWLLHPDAFPFDQVASREAASPVQNANAPLLPTHRLGLFSVLLGASAASSDLFNVGRAHDGLVSMPKTALIVGGRDPFRDESLLYGARLRESGVPTKTHVFPGMPHGFRKLTQLPSSRRWDALMLELIGWLVDDTTAALNQPEVFDLVVEDTTAVPADFSEKQKAI